MVLTDFHVLKMESLTLIYDIYWVTTFRKKIVLNRIWLGNLLHLRLIMLSWFKPRLHRRVFARDSFSNCQQTVVATRKITAF